MDAGNGLGLEGSPLEEGSGEGGVAQAEIQQFVCFKLFNEEYAIGIRSLQEVIRVPRVTPVPQMPDFCLGMINIRGDVAALFDLRKLFHLAQKEFDSGTRILVVRIDHVVMSLVVDEILDNIKLDSSQIEPTPAVKMSIERDCIKGLGNLEGRMIALLDLVKIHGVIRRVIENNSRESRKREADKK